MATAVQPMATISSPISVDSLSHQPTKFWNKVKVKQTVKKLRPLSSETQISEANIRFVCLSDTHDQTSKMSMPLPAGDVLLHAGDFTMVGTPKEVERFNEFLGSLSYRRKIIIAGNHDLSFDSSFLTDPKKMLDSKARFGLNIDDVKSFMSERRISAMKEVLTNCTYLEDSATDVCGIKIYGSPWQPKLRRWAFNLSRGHECLEKWNLIPEDTDVLITHGPPVGHGDNVYNNQQRAGCVELLNTVQNRVHPKMHLFGHIHEGYGLTTDSCTTYINACTCTLRYKPTNPAIVFDLPIPEGHTKNEL